MSETDPVRVVIADDNELFCAALRAILEPEPGVVVVGLAADGDAALRLAGELRPDVVLMDLSMPVLDGFLATERMRAEAPDTKVVVLTGSADDEDVERARAAGAAVYVTKERIAVELVQAVRTAARR
jgi:DNA-binding NarL/FixJ family response regulator